MEIWDPDTNSTRPMTEEEREEYTWIMEAAFDACRTEEEEPHTER